MKKILITGAGGAAAIAFINAVRQPSRILHAADMDPNAAGLFLVSAKRRHLIPAASSRQFADNLLDLCQQLDISILVPTVDAELLPLARRRRDFGAIGVDLMMASEPSLAYCLDKAKLIEHCQTTVPCPKTVTLTPDSTLDDWPLPAIAKPRRGSGSRGVRRIESRAQLRALPRNGSLILQEELPGEEYSVDVLTTPAGRILAAVPRCRMKVDSGVAVTAMTFRDSELETLSAVAVRRTGLTFVANVQWKRDREGTPRLLEINPRFPGTMPLTVASGVDMPNLCLRLIHGRSIEQEELRFTAQAMVRTWREHFLEPSELLATADQLTTRSRSLEACA